MKKSRMLQSCQLGCSWRMGFAKSTQRCALQESKNWKLFIFQQKHSSIEPTVGQMQPQQTLEEEFHSIISFFFLFLLLHLHSKWIGLKWIYRSVFDVAQNVSEPWKLFVTVRVAFDVTNRGLEWNDDKIAHPTLIVFLSDICLFRDFLQNIVQPHFMIFSGKKEKKEVLKSRNWPHQERKSSRQWQ